MITQSLQFEVTGQDVQRFLMVCQAKGMEPKDAFGLFLRSFISEIDGGQKPAVKKSSYAGGLAQFANPELMALEESAVASAIKAKYGAH